jgi:DNA invertase Pin-like site-specific DNA recombinase
VLATVSKRGAGFRSLSDQWADTTMPHGRLMLTVLGSLAEFERTLILARTGEGGTIPRLRVDGRLRPARKVTWRSVKDHGISSGSHG